MKAQKKHKKQKKRKSNESTKAHLHFVVLLCDFYALRLMCLCAFVLWHFTCTFV
jgi:hypothetical protein